MKNLILAVDGGQSSTLALAADTEGHILGAGLAGPSNHIHEVGGMERMQNALRQSIAKALEDAGATESEVIAACLGMTGGATTARDIVQTVLPNARVQAHDDMVTALAGASMCQPGVIVIAGTGAVAYGQLANGRSAKADGWGYIMGDEGSAYDIGVKALKAATRAIDGRKMETTLVERIPQHFGLPDLYAVHGKIYSQQFTRPHIAGLAAIVSTAAQENDSTARELLADAGKNLAGSALAVIKRLDRIEAGLNVYTTGGVFHAGDWILIPFRIGISDLSPNSTVQPAAYSPALGALFLALQAANIDLTPWLLETIRSTLPETALSKHQQPS